MILAGKNLMSCGFKGSGESADGYQRRPEAATTQTRPTTTAATFAALRTGGALSGYRVPREAGADGNAADGFHRSYRAEALSRISVSSIVTRDARKDVSTQ